MSRSKLDMIIWKLIRETDVAYFRIERVGRFALVTEQAFLASVYLNAKGEQA